MGNRRMGIGSRLCRGWRRRCRWTDIYYQWINGVIDEVIGLQVEWEICAISILSLKPFFSVVGLKIKIFFSWNQIKMLLVENNWKLVPALKLMWAAIWIVQPCWNYKLNYKPHADFLNDLEQNTEICWNNLIQITNFVKVFLWKSLNWSNYCKWR